VEELKAQPLLMLQEEQVA